MVFGVPTMYGRIAREAETDRSIADAFAGARVLISGSAALPVSVHERMRQLTGQSILERYGMTETLMNTGARLGEPVIAGRVGPPLPGVEVKLVDEDGATIEPSDDETIGEIAVRGPNLFTGYLNRPDATEEAMRDGWFMTGDLATRDASGSIKHVGRKTHRPDQVGRVPDRRRRDRGRAARAPGRGRGGGCRRARSRPG